MKIKQLRQPSRGQIQREVESKLIFDPDNRTLFDSRGQILKHINCPDLKSWHHLVPIISSEVSQRHCDSCNRVVLDTGQMTPEKIIRAATDDPDVCFRIKLDQDNIEVKVKNDWWPK